MGHPQPIFPQAHSISQLMKIIPLKRDMLLEQIQGRHSDCNKIEEEKRQMLELLNEEFDLDNYSDSDSDSDTDCKYQTLV